MMKKIPGEKPFKCPMPDCVPTSVAFSQLPHLKKHMLSIHGRLLNSSLIPISF